MNTSNETANLEAQYDQLIGLTQNSPNALVREITRVLSERMTQFKAGEIAAEQVKATIDIQIETLQALQALSATAPVGDSTPNLHETDVALKVLEIGLKLVPLLLV